MDSRKDDIDEETLQDYLERDGRFIKGFFRLANDDTEEGEE